MWLVNGPFHPFWNWWLVGVIHLRPIEGVKPPNLKYQGAEYEFMIVSLNPERGTPDVGAVERGEDWGDLSKPKFLTPADVVVQFHGVTDEQAAEICDLAIEAIVAGQASPDQDFRSWWEAAIANSVKHVRGEVH